MPPSPENAPTKNKKRKLFFAVLSSFFLLALALTAVFRLASRAPPRSPAIGDLHREARSLIKSSCSSTLYPDLCFSQLTSSPSSTASAVKTPKDVIALALNLTVAYVQHNYFAIKKVTAGRRGLTARERTALLDCLEMVDDTLDEVRKTLAELLAYPSGGNKSASELAEDMKTLLSAAMTNQETCLDGFSHDSADKKVREALLGGQMHVFHLCSNALAMVKNMTDADMANERLSSNRRLKEEGPIRWPEWLSAGDRRLLQSTTVTPDVTVAADGSGDYGTVAAAVAAAPEGSTRRYIIKIKAGVYRENVEVPKKKVNLMFVGDGRTTTIITASRNVVDGSTTFNSATVAVVGDGFLARDITFQNTAGPSKHQAVALRVGADLSAFHRCNMLAYQDTLYVHSLRQFYVGCFVAGTIDFIFGNAAAVLQDCDIHARRPNAGQRNMVTAQGRDDPNQNTGIVIQKCRIGATSDLLALQGSVETYLGRPWKMYSRTVIMQTEISDVIDPAGWYQWDGDFALDTLYYAEYANTGAGASTANRVTWKGHHVISASEAQAFTAGEFIAGSSWLDSTGFPYSLGL
ncbi:pectinesterase-like [Rhodamnia argentea]|uniref:Pectinesterase n=1 Tax=Rhodamnia argentea TaxID=178133 RepID=A0A8B8P9K5_9MYRT|nr:pectinesterase-like [Rhodamnia argentea]